MGFAFRTEGYIRSPLVEMRGACRYFLQGTRQAPQQIVYFNGESGGVQTQGAGFSTFPHSLSLKHSLSTALSRRSW